jgi:DNA-binding XRE family transcriptional regulator
MSSESWETTEQRGEHERELNEQAQEHDAEVKRAEEESEAIEHPEPQEPTDPDQLRGEIAETREELGQTVEALAAKADVKAQAREKVDETKAQAQEKVNEAKQQVNQGVEQAKQKPQIPVAAGVIALLLLVLLLRRRSK